MSDAIGPSYTYAADVIYVHDGDTLSADLDLGLGIWSRGQKIRLRGINAPELRLPDKSGEKAQAALAKVLNLSDRKVVIKTAKGDLRKEKFGRWLGVIYAMDKAGQQFCVNDWMLMNNYAVPMAETLEQ
jgi:micrococcal nuclease